MLKNIFQFCILLSASVVFAQEINQMDADGNRHGFWQKKFEGSEQVRYEGTFKNGKETGLFKYYKKGYKKQPAATKLFSENSDLAQVKFFTAKGKLVSEGEMKGENRHGKWIYYHGDSDQVMMIEFYDNDILQGKKLTYFNDGKLAEEAVYKNGVLHGKTKIYGSTGNILKEYTYENGELHGPVKYYDAHGNLEIEGNYKNNLMDGIWKYYQNGKVSETKKYPEAFHSKK